MTLNGLNWTRVSLGEAVTFLSSMSFLLSAMAHAAIFAYWGFDFLAIATVEDVLLGGIRILLLAAIMLFVALASSGALHIWMRHPERAGSIHNWLRRSLVFLFIVALMALSIFTFVTGARVPTRESTILSLAALSILSLLFFVFAVLTSTKRLQDLIPPITNRLRYGVAFIALFSTAVIMASLATEHYLNIFVVSGTGHLPPRCGSNNDQILWLGSKAMIIRCQGRRHVVFYGDDPPVLGEKPWLEVFESKSPPR